MPTRIICAAINKVDWFGLGDGSVSLERPYMVRILGCLAEASCLLRIIMFLGIAYGLGTLFNDIRGETSAYAQDGPTELTDIWVSVLCTHS